MPRTLRTPYPRSLYWQFQFKGDHTVVKAISSAPIKLVQYYADEHNNVTGYVRFTRSYAIPIIKNFWSYRTSWAVTSPSDMALLWSRSPPAGTCYVLGDEKYCVNTQLRKAKLYIPSNDDDALKEENKSPPLSSYQQWLENRPSKDRKKEDLSMARLITEELEKIGKKYEDLIKAAPTVGDALTLMAARDAEDAALALRFRAIKS